MTSWISLKNSLDGGACAETNALVDSERMYSNPSFSCLFRITMLELCSAISATSSWWVVKRGIKKCISAEVSGRRALARQLITSLSWSPSFSKRFWKQNASAELNESPLRLVRELISAPLDTLATNHLISKGLKKRRLHKPLICPSSRRSRVLTPSNFANALKSDIYVFSSKPCRG